MSDWAILRQVVIATSHHDSDVAAVRRAFGLGQGFADPELKKLNLLDATLPVAAGRYLEFVAPDAPTGSVANWLAKVGGRGGYTLSIQHPDTAAVLRRATDMGVRVPIQEEAFGHPVLQMHPKDVGLVLEVDGIADPSVWFWDDIDPGPEPGALVGDVLAVEVPVADPAATAAQWRTLLDLPEQPDATCLQIGATVRFVDDDAAAGWRIVLRRASEHATDPQLPGVRFDFA